jgi:hypothetical protein
LCFFPRHNIPSPFAPIIAPGKGESKRFGKTGASLPKQVLILPFSTTEFWSHQKEEVFSHEKAACRCPGAVPAGPVRRC